MQAQEVKTKTILDLSALSNFLKSKPGKKKKKKKPASVLGLAAFEKSLETYQQKQTKAHIVKNPQDKLQLTLVEEILGHNGGK